MSKIFYHSADLDGHCSGAILKLEEPEAQMYPIDYGDDFPWEAIRSTTERVYMVDFSLQPFEDMVKLNSMCDLVWIDHHKSSIEKYNEWVKSSCGFRIGGLRCIGIGAASLAWEYFNGPSVPSAIQRVAEYDVWKLDNPDTLPFQFGARMYNTDPSTEEGLNFWESVIHSRMIYKEVIVEGRIALRYQKQLYKKYCKNAFHVDFYTPDCMYNCIALNLPFANSQVFDSVENIDDYDIMILFYMRANGKYTVSLYTKKDDIDVSAIALKYGGGGHKQAAGFICDYPPFLEAV